jgi:hypothetical protein
MRPLDPIAHGRPTSILVNSAAIRTALVSSCCTAAISGADRCHSCNILAVRSSDVDLHKTALGLPPRGSTLIYAARWGRSIVALIFVPPDVGGDNEVSVIINRVQLLMIGKLHSRSGSVFTNQTDPIERDPDIHPRDPGKYQINPSRFRPRFEAPQEKRLVHHRVMVHAKPAFPGPQRFRSNAQHRHAAGGVPVACLVFL